jgi:hypothetical protein
MDIATLLNRAIGISAGDIIELQRLPFRSLNETWRCVLKGWPLPLYVKIQGRTYPSTTVSDEAQVLCVLKDRLPLVPRLITYGQEEESRRPYLITEERPGLPVHHLLNDVNLPTPYKLLYQVADWLCEFKMNSYLRPLLERRLDRAVGVYQPDFDPITAALKLCSEIQEVDRGELASVFRALLAKGRRGNWPRSPREIVHGSLTTFNLLANVIGSEKSLSLTGVLDFEATRIGNAMFDVATLALYLLMSAWPAGAKVWFSTCAHRFGESRVMGEALPFLVYCYLARARAKFTGTAIGLPSDDAVQAFLNGW